MLQRTSETVKYFVNHCNNYEDNSTCLQWIHNLKCCSPVLVSTSDNTEFRLEFELLLRKSPTLKWGEMVALAGELRVLDTLLLATSWSPNVGLVIFSTAE